MSVPEEMSREELSRRGGNYFSEQLFLRTEMMDECRMTDPQILGQWPHGQFTDAVRRDVRGYLLEQFGTAMLVTQFPAVDRRAVLHLQEPTQYRKHSSTGNTAVPETQQYRKHGSTGNTAEPVTR